MIIRLFLLCCLHTVVELSSIDGSLYVVEGGHSTSRRHAGTTRDDIMDRRRGYLEAAQRYNQRQIAHSRDVIFAPLNGKSIITKQRMFVNTGEDEIRMNRVYDDLVNPVPSAYDDLDPIFVTPPPQRTTVAVKYDEIVEHSGDDINAKNVRANIVTATTPMPPAEVPDLVSPKIISSNRYFTSTISPSQLKLVTLPRQPPTTPPPFKYGKALASGKSSVTPIIFGTNEQPRPADAASSSLVRFPAQPWQIPPRDPSLLIQPPPPANWMNIFDQNNFLPGAQNGLIPQNPFAPFMPQNQNLGNGNNPLNFTNPFLPIGVSEPAPVPGFPAPFSVGNGAPPQTNPFQQRQGNTQPWESQLIHRSPFRSGGFAKTREIASIALPEPGAMPAARPPYSGFPPPKPPTTDFSIDSAPQTYEKTESFRQPPAKTFTVNNGAYGGGYGFQQSYNLRQFAKEHPSFVNAIQKPQQTVDRTSRPATPQPPPPAPIVPVTSPPPRVPYTPSPYNQQSGSNSGASGSSSGYGSSGTGSNSAPSTGYGSSGQQSVLVQTLTPNQKLDLCCRKQMITGSCQNMCNFDTFNDKSLVNAFLLNQCPNGQLGKAYDCASSKADHTECCSRMGLQTLQGGRCMPFCRTHQSTPSNVFEYVSCLQVFELVKGCYKEHQINNKNIFGD